MTKNCPYCGRKFNLWQRAIGEAREHVRACAEHHSPARDMTRATGCRGCPAGCYERAGFAAQRRDRPQD